MPTSILSTTTLNTFGKRLKVCRHARGLSTQVFTAHVGITKNYLSLLENDAGPVPSVPLLQRMAVVLEVTTSQLLGETPLT